MFDTQSALHSSPDLALAKGNSTNYNKKLMLSGASFELPSEENKLTVQYQHTKHAFKKMVKRMSEDESSLWHDKLEQQ